MILVAFVTMLSTSAGSLAAPALLYVKAEAAALIDVQSGRIIYSKAGDKRMRIASLTKIMTAIVAIERGKLSDVVQVSKNAAGKEGSSIYLKQGEEMSLHNMLYGLMLRSGNDAATAIAEHVGGSLEGFVFMMNETARMIGMTGSEFKNPSGLDEEGHYATANDMAKLTAYALSNPAFQDIVKTKIKTAPNPNDPWDYKWTNKNKMLTFYPGADGVKTGYTKLALRCLVSSATRNGQQLAVVTLNDSDDWADHTRMLDYGFNNYPLTEIVRKGDRLEGMPIAAGKTFRYPLNKDEQGAVRKDAKLLQSSSSTGYVFGERGSLEVYVNNQLVGSVPLYEENSPRLKLTDNEAFKYKDYGLEFRSVRGNWPAALQSAFIRLLSPAGR
jgi:D-alanyl-D-alanine carboxypeptidase